MKSITNTTAVHYWKYVEKQFVQPVLTSNTSSEVIKTFASANSSIAYRVFDGGSGYWVTPNDVWSGTLYIHFNRVLKINSITVVGLYSDSDFHIINATINGITKTFSRTDITQVFEFETPYEVMDMTVVSHGKGWTGIQEMTINATYIDVEEGTAEDYDFITEDKEYYLPKKNNRHYYKYVYEQWNQPVGLTANGDIGGTRFAMNQSSVYSTNYAYRALAGSGSLWHSGQAIPAWLEWYNPVPIRIDKLYFEVGNTNTNKDYPKDYKIQASNDGTNWVDIYSATNTSTQNVFLPIEIDLTGVQNREYKYWRYYIETVLGRSFGNMRNLVITAKTRAIGNGTANDYDYYVDADDYYGIQE